MYHIHPDDGITELEELRIPFVNQNDEDTCIREIVGISLYNFSINLIRYKTGDFVTLPAFRKSVHVNKFPSIASVIGVNWISLSHRREKNCRDIVGIQPCAGNYYRADNTGEDRSAPGKNSLCV